MAICSFIGNSKICDRQLFQKLRTTIHDIAEEQEHTEFLLVPVGEDFFYCCLKAVLEIRTCFPEKTTVTFVVDKKDQSEIFTPTCFADGIREIDVPPSSFNRGAYRIRNIKRSVIQFSTHVVCYVYENFYESENRLLAYARKRRNLTIVDISTQETAEAIRALANMLPEQRERSLIEQLNNGHTIKEISAMLGVSGERIHQLRARAGRHLRDMLNDRLSFDEIIRGKNRRLTCAVFSLGFPPAQKLRLFRSVISLLTSQYHVTTFEIHARYCHSDYTEAIKWNRFLDKARLTAVLINDDDKDIYNLVGQYCPPCNRVANIDATLISGPHDFKVGAAMTERADFCVCDLSASPVAKELTKHIAYRTGVCLLDIGRNSFYKGYNSLYGEKICR